MALGCPPEPEGGTGMEAAKAAQIFHDWAIQEGLMSESPVASASSPAELAQVSPASEDGKAILRQKRILSVGFNEAAREIVAYTKLAAPAGKKTKALLPSLIDDVKIKYHQGNHTKAGDAPVLPFGGPPYVIRNVGGANRLACGSSISVGNCVDAGTLGALVRDQNGAMFGLSNNHVSASCSHAEAGLPVVAPGLADVAAGGLHPFTIGLHEKALPMIIGSPTVVDISNNSDAAIFKIINEAQLSSFQGTAYDTPAATAPLAAGIEVEKVGRTTGHTKGYVESQYFGPLDVNYHAPRYGFSGRIFFKNAFAITGVGSSFSDNGDSGSLITAVIDGERRAVGIVFGGSPSGKAPGGILTVALPIEPILQALNVTLVAGHNI